MTCLSYPQPPPPCSPSDCGVCRDGYAPDALITGAGACAKCLRHLHAIASDDDDASSTGTVAALWPTRTARTYVADLEAGWDPSAPEPARSGEADCCAPRFVASVPVGGVWVAAGEEPPLQQRVKCSRIAGCVLMSVGLCLLVGGLFALIAGRMRSMWVFAVVFPILGMAAVMSGFLLLVGRGARHTHE